MPVHICHQHFSIGLLFVSFIEAFCGSYTALCLCEQLRIAYVTEKNLSFFHRLMWYVSIGISLGGVGIWAMHFIGMTALSISDTETGEHLKIKFNVGVSLLSIVTVVAMTSLGALISSYDKLFAKSKHEILEMFAAQSSTLSLAQIQKMKKHRLILLMSTKSLGKLVLGGVVAGSGVCVMHYIGMEAMEIDGHIRWDIGIITASCLIAIIAATAAFWILFRLLSIFPEKEWLRVMAAGIMTVAVCGMHYTGMAAATMVYDPSNVIFQEVAPQTLTQSEIVFPVFVVSACVLFGLHMLAFTIMHARFHRYFYHLKKTNQLDKVRNNFQRSAASSSLASASSSAKSIGSSSMVMSAKSQRLSAATTTTGFAPQSAKSFGFGNDAIHPLPPDVEMACVE